MSIEFFVGARAPQSSSGFPYRGLYAVAHSFQLGGELNKALKRTFKKVLEYPSEVLRSFSRERLERLLEDPNLLFGHVLNEFSLENLDSIEFFFNLNPIMIKFLSSDWFNSDLFKIILENCDEFEKNRFLETYGFSLDEVENLLDDKQRMSFFKYCSYLLHKYIYTITYHSRYMLIFCDPVYYEMRDFILNDPVYKSINKYLKECLKEYGEFLNEEYLVPLFLSYAPHIYALPEDAVENGSVREKVISLAVRRGVELIHGSDESVSSLDEEIKEDFLDFIDFLDFLDDNLYGSGEVSSSKEMNLGSRVRFIINHFSRSVKSWYEFYQRQEGDR